MARYVFGPEIMDAFRDAGMVPDAVQRITVDIKHDEFVNVTAEFAISVEQFEQITKHLKERTQ